MPQDVFLSHASRDKRDYVNPLAAAFKLRGLTFWLDAAEIAWGDNVTSKINAGLRNSRYALVCLSAHFLERPWPEAELSAALSLQNTDGTKRVLPLILNDRERVLQHYPLIGGMAFREFSAGPKTIAEEIAAMVRRKKKPRGTMRVTVESVHTGVQSHLDVTTKNSVKWLRDITTRNLGLRADADVGGFAGLPIRWVLVDVATEDYWAKMTHAEQDKTYAIVLARERVNVCTDEDTSLGALGIEDGKVFHLYAIEEVIRRGGGGAGRGARYK